MSEDVEVSQTSLDSHVDRTWKIKFLMFLRRVRRLFSYSKSERALVELGLARKCLVEGLDNQVGVKQVFELVEEGERLFEEKRFDECIEVSRKAVRKARVKRSGCVDALFLGRRLNKMYGGVPCDEVERRHVVLKACSLVQGVDGLFTKSQVENVLEQGFSGSDCRSELLDGVDGVLENHGDVVEQECFAGVPLYKLEQGV